MTRIDKVLERAGLSKTEGVIIHKPSNIFYLSGYTGEGLLVFGHGFKAIITFGSGITAQVEVGTSNFINLPRWYMLGENGSAVMDDWHNGKIVMVSDWENRDAVPVQTSAGWTKTMAPRTADTITEYPLPKVDVTLKDYYRNIARVVHGEESQWITHEQMLRDMRFMEACFYSAEHNCVVTDFE